ncbi:hypothetical protein M413DRAFT_417151 [Hebeloma cylindrosporum]|uniref:NAD-dependent epimerase/dehydratase domain-containing protein n=1 Tax=Hebeloma cylindrosporum TaxID=76867 RepID=A0A0C3CG91_HEBCY|nr:hypothetical protein M413DRAFT_417151 [Hebeloma cylindrosporum h7]
MSCKVVICGAGFLGRHIGKVLLNSRGSESGSSFQVQMSSRRPEKIWEALHSEIAGMVPHNRLLPPVAVDITRPLTIKEAFKDASVVVSLVGIMHGALQDFERIQWEGAENVAIAARDAGAKLIHFSAIGADPKSSIPYTRTKGLGEQSVLAVDPTATIIRPSLVFGPEDDFFNRFARLSKILPFLPVFGGGAARFQPVYVDDLACAVAIIARNDPKIKESLEGKIIEAGGPQIFTYRELMQLILDTTGRKRPIISLPFALGILQGAILERLPLNLFTVTQAQVEQLKSDNVVSPHLPPNHLSLEDFLSRNGEVPLHNLHEILPTYLR